MGDILYGIKRAIAEELDETTQLPKAGGVKCIIEMAESAEMSAVTSDGDEELKRSDSKILAIVRTPDLLYGYDVTFTDNLFDAKFMALIEGGVITYDDNGNVTGYRSPMISEGATNMKPFRLTLYVANYEGDSIKNYVKVVLNKCEGKAPDFNAAKEFYAPEFSIKAREATKAGLPVRQLSYVDSIPNYIPEITATSIGKLDTTCAKLYEIPEDTTVANLLAALTYEDGLSVAAYTYDEETGTYTEMESTDTVDDNTLIGVYETDLTTNIVYYTCEIIG